MLEAASKLQLKSGDRAELHAQELRTLGLTLYEIPPAILASTLEVFERTVTTALKASSESTVVHVPQRQIYDSWYQMLVGCLPIRKYSFYICSQGSQEYNRYINPATLRTLRRLSDPVKKALEPLTSAYFGKCEPVCVVNAQFIIGKSNSNPVLHQDFYSKNAISILMPLYEYTAEQASLLYWRLDENPAMYEATDTRAGVEQRTYKYRCGEAIVISGDMFHQTKPYTEPKLWGGGAPCRALFCVVLVGADSIIAEESYPTIRRNLLAPTAGYFFDPALRRWIEPGMAGSDYSTQATAEVKEAAPEEAAPTEAAPVEAATEDTESAFI